MIVDAGTLDAHVRCNLSKTETVEAALPYSPLSGVHDGGGDVTHWVCSRGYLSIGRAYRDQKQCLSVYLSIGHYAKQGSERLSQA
jgi:hypothetical protein